MQQPEGSTIDSSPSPSTHSTFRLMTYNVLADQYAQEHCRELYSAVPWVALEWNTRAAMIAKEVEYWGPDVVCFQEVDHFEQLQGLLKPHGYKGVYTARTGGRPDGLAMFWKRSRFTTEAMQVLEFAHLGLKDNVCQLTVLKSKDSAFALLVANIHVLFNPKRGDIKLGQVRTMLEAAHTLVSARPSGPCPVVVCGDFNSAVGSPLYEFMLQGQLELGSTDRRRLSGQVEVAGRTGWPTIRDAFLQALSQGARSEADAMAAAVGALPSYSSMTDPYNSLREPKLLDGLDSPAARMMLPAASPPMDRRDSASSGSSSMKNSSRSGKAFRGWAPEDIKLAAGNGPESRQGVAKHPLQLQSAYLSVAGTEPLYTTVHDKYVGTVDYIFYSPDLPAGGDEVEKKTQEQPLLKPVKVLQPPSLRTMQTGLPSLGWPSDHLSLLADFEIKHAEPASDSG